MSGGSLTKLFLVVIAIIVIGVFTLNPLLNVVNLGLDLKGGVHVVLQAQGTEENPVTAEDMQQLQAVMRERVDELGVSEPIIQPEGNDRLIIELAGVDNPDQAVAILGKTAMLEFRNPEGETVLTGADLEDAGAIIEPNTNEPKVTLKSKPEGAKIFAEVTSKNVGRQLPIILDGQVISSPNVNGPITGGNAEISGGYESFDEAASLAALLRAGALPVDVKIMEKRTVGPTLGQDSINKSAEAVLIGLVAIALIMVIVYRLPGILAILSLVIYAILVLGIMNFINAVLTLPGIAGLLLSVGMAVDANVIIYERFKEELRTGKTLRAAVDAGFKRAFWTIVDANVTTLIAAAVLYYFGSGPIRGFAVTLSIGIIVSMFTAITLTRLLLRLAVRVQVLRNNRLYGVSKGGEA